jgi:hypothetical protein
MKQWNVKKTEIWIFANVPTPAATKKEFAASVYNII